MRLVTDYRTDLRRWRLLCMMYVLYGVWCTLCMMYDVRSMMYDVQCMNDT
jgi:hypothetical protein